MSIDFSMENIKKCLCMRCPVQMESQCVKNKEKNNVFNDSARPGQPYENG